MADKVVNESILNQCCLSLDKILNGKKKGEDRCTGFLLFVFPLNEPIKRCECVTNGDTGEDNSSVVYFLEEQLRLIKQGIEKGKV
jgi:hypothetical protein